MPGINCNLNEIQRDKIKVLVYRKKIHGKSYYTYQLGKYDDENNLPMFLCPQTNEAINDMEYVKACTIRIVVTGDLAWYAAALGKVNMSSNWCTWCNGSGNEWIDEGHTKGELWTLDKMRDLREKILTNEIEATAQNRKGVVDVELLPSISIQQYIYPILHAEIGLGNYILNSFFTWVDYRIEDISEEEINKKELMIGIIEDLREMEERVSEFDKQELTDLKIERVQMKEVRGFRNADGTWANTLVERKEIDLLVKELNVSIKVLEKEWKEINANLKLKRQVYMTVKAELDKYRAKRGKKGEVRIKLESKLHEYGIRRPTYHGGDLTGVKIKKLLQSIDVIFEDFRNIIIEQEDRLADDEEVHKMTSMYSTLGFLVDGIFSLGRTKCGELNEDMISLTRRMVIAFVRMWRYLRLSMKGPKIHGMEDHLLDQMIEYAGIGEFCEDFVEQAHQYGVKEEIRTRGLERSKAFISHSKWEWNSNRIGVRKAKEEIRRRTSRKRKRGTIESRMSSKLSRDEKRMASLETVERGNYEMILDSRTQQKNENEMNVILTN